MSANSGNVGEMVEMWVVPNENDQSTSWDGAKRYRGVAKRGVGKSKGSSSAFCAPSGRGGAVPACSVQYVGFRTVDVRLPGKRYSNSHGARPVHLIITMIKWIRTSRLSIQNSLFP